MRRTAIFLAVAVAAIDLGTYVWNEFRLAAAVGSVISFGVGAFISRLVLSLAFVLPWVVGAALFWRGRRALGAAVIVPTAVLTAPGVLFLGQWLGDLVDVGGSAGAWIELGAATTMWGAAIVAGVVAWRSRPAAGTRLEAPGLGNVYVVLAFLAWLPMVLVSTHFLTPGATGTDLAARPFYEFIWEDSGGLGAAVGISEALLFGSLLLLGPLVRRDAAGAVVTVIAFPALVREVQTILEVASERLVVSTPASYLGVVGLLGVVVIGITWLRQGAPRAKAAARTAASVPSDEDEPADEER